MLVANSRVAISIGVSSGVLPKHRINSQFMRFMNEHDKIMINESYKVSR